MRAWKTVKKSEPKPINKFRFAILVSLKKIECCHMENETYGGGSYKLKKTGKSFIKSFDDNNSDYISFDPTLDEVPPSRSSSKDVYTPKCMVQYFINWCDKHGPSVRITITVKSAKQDIILNKDKVREFFNAKLDNPLINILSNVADDDDSESESD